MRRDDIKNSWSSVWPMSSYGRTIANPGLHPVPSMVKCTNLIVNEQLQPNQPQSASTRRQHRMQEQAARARRLHPGSKFPSFAISLTLSAKALREIQYYDQSAPMAETCLLPFQPFARLVKEIAHEVRTINDDHRWEKDALVCLQLFTEHILIMVFEMMYSCL